MPTLRMRKTLVLYLCLLTMACKKNGSGPGDSNLPDVVDNHQQPTPTAVGVPVGSPSAKVIGAAGGTLYSPDSVLRLTIPAGALSTNTNISIQPVTSQLPGGVGLCYDLLPNGAQFSVPATVAFRYTSEEVSDNFPFFLNIAYQDNNYVWQGDLRHCMYDSVAMTVSLNISHFTIYGFQDGITIYASPRSIMTGQTSSLTLEESMVILQDSSYITQTTPIPPDFVGQWSVNGIPNGNSSVGTVSGSGNNVVYHAPANLDHPIEVFVAAQLKMHEIYFIGNTKMDIVRPKRGVLIRVFPYQEYDFTVKLFYIDSTVSPFYRQVSSPPVYSDHAQFDVHLKAKLDAPVIEMSNLQNFPPDLTSATYTLDNTVWTWAPDPYGMMDVASLTLNHEMILEDSLVTVYVNHGHATLYGYVTYTSGVLVANVPPAPYVASYGIPPTFVIDLKQTPPYLKTLAGGGKAVSYAILPKQ
jgi:hypothetical protein